MTQLKAIATLTLFLMAPTAALSADRPNIVILLADDLGYSGLGCYGSDFHETPNLDRLAAAGVRFTDAYAACTVCSPTRASVMTGKYPARLHLTDFIAGQDRPHARLKIPEWVKGLPLEEMTIAEALKEAGYATAHVGKWHLEPPRSGEQFRPNAHGFDHEVFKPAARGYFINPRLVQSGEVRSGYVTDHLTDRALDLIDKMHPHPFFLYMAYHTPHTPIQGKPELVERYRNRLRPGLRHDNPEYAAMVHSLDESVGRILEKLDRLRIAERTVVIFLSDNGGLTQRFGKPTGYIDNYPLRRGKGSAYEGGTRVPWIMRYPPKTPADATCAEPVSTIDLLPTILELAGVALDREIDGRSLAPLMADPGARLGREALYWHYPHYHAGGDGPYGAVRAGPWKLIESYETSQVELYHLGNDIGETTDVSDREPQRAARLRETLAAWRERVGAQMPTPNPNYDPEKALAEARGDGE